MKFFVYMIVLIAAIAGITIFVHHPDNTQAFQVSGLNYDAGNIKKGHLVSHAVVFTNSGTVPLVLQSVVVGCDCTTVNPSHTIIAPGGSRSVSLKVDTSDMDAGPQIREVSFDFRSRAKVWSETATISMTVSNFR